MAKTVVDALSSKFGTKILETQDHHGDEVVVVSRDALVEIATWLRDDDKMAFDCPVFVTCIDRLGLAQEPRFEVCFQLRSSRHRHRLRIKVRASDDDPKVPSLAGLWPAFNWQERETFDMYGIQFEGHPDLRRIYLYDEFQGHPLRKDYPKDKRQPLARRDWSE